MEGNGGKWRKIQVPMHELDLGPCRLGWVDKGRRMIMRERIV